MPVSGEELAREQAYVAQLYARLDLLRERTAAQLDRVRRQGASGTHQARSERDAFATLHTDRLAQLWAVEHGLCFGRLDLTDSARQYIGRLGLSDDEYNNLLVDWRAPAAQPYYRATSGSPDGVVLRRHLRTRDRTVVGVDDDVFDLDALSAADRSTLNGEAALLAALAANRTGRMGDIVATIQSEQDRVIRSDLSGVLVVQGGPGTGKTAVALHRAAYLLYTYRERLAKRGVLVVGPNPTFLRYIGQVLPSLGETDVVLSTVADMFPGEKAVAAEPVETATLKGDLRMVDVIAAAIRDRQHVAATPVELTIAGRRLRLERRTLERARTLGRRSRKLHNEARRVVVRRILTDLTEALARMLGRTELDAGDRTDLTAELRDEPAVQALLDRIWPQLTPQQLLEELYADPARLTAATPGLSAHERRLLARPAGSDWTAADIPLLDEAAELLGEDDPAAAAAAARAAQRQQWELAYAQEVLDVLQLNDLLDPALVADRYRESDAFISTAERAAADRTWAFGHVIVDEAQELSAMAWRMVMRRCPSRSMTVVGDLAQTGAPWGARSWTDVIEPYASGRWRVEELTVNYRTPTEVMAVAAQVLAVVAPELTPPASVREAGIEPWVLQVQPAELADALTATVTQAITDVGDGRLAILVPAGRAEEFGALLAHIPGVAIGSGATGLDASGVVLAVDEAKGLEFDSVVLVEPGQVLAESPRGGSDLYVALTRTTQRLGVVSTGGLPAPLRALRPPVHLVSGADRG